MSKTTEAAPLTEREQKLIDALEELFQYGKNFDRRVRETALKALRSAGLHLE